MITQETIQQIVNRIDIIEVVGAYVKLKKRGVNYLGLCPFHNEKTPSFTVSPTKEIYKCFGCGRSGNTISFLMEHEKFSYVEALRWLAARYNIAVEETETSPEFKEQRQTADSLYIINKFAQQFFSQSLHESEEGKSVGLSYLKERGFRQEVIRKFELGYGPETRDAFAKAALEAQFSRELLLKTGLVVERDQTLQDNYRGRIIFPIHHPTGKIAGFGARIIRNNDRAPKYINTPENEIYLKSKILYGSYFARQAIDRADECLLVEGYTDVLALHQAGIENVVASGGTSLTIDQLRIIKKYTSNLTILYDGDPAGIKAALRGLDLALEEGLNVKMALLPDREDPDSFLRKYGAARFTEFIRTEKKDFLFFQLEQSLLEAGDDSNKRSAAVNRIAETISRINKAEDFVKQQDYIRKTAELLSIDETGLHTLVNKHIRERLTREEKRTSSPEIEQVPIPGYPTSEGQEDMEALELLGKEETNERAVVRCLLEFGQMEWEPGTKVADYLLSEWIDEEMITLSPLQKIVSAYSTLHAENMEPTAKNFLYGDDQEISRLVVSLIEFPYEISPNWMKQYEVTVPTREDNYRQEITSSLKYLHLKKIKKLISQNQKELETATSPDRQKFLMQSHIHLKDMEAQITQELGVVVLK